MTVIIHYSWLEAWMALSLYTKATYDMRLGGCHHTLEYVTKGTIILRYRTVWYNMGAVAIMIYFLVLEC